jgi:RimJ/RimL family protein N-acetyltransferase
MTAYTYKEARVEDAPALFDFGRILLAETNLMLLTPDERAKTVDDMRIVIERFIEMPRHFLVNAWLGETVVGEALCMGGQFERNRHTGRVGVGVLKAHHGKGLGRALMAEIERLARAADMHRLELTVMAHNERAKSLYGSLGYVEEGLNRDSLRVDGDFVDEIVMAKLLD